ncbi:MAG: nucleotidyltransferase [Syntrophobacteraceae bacterium]
MKTSDQYLKQIISKYRSDEYGVKTQVQTIYPLIQDWAHQYLVDGFYSGSIARGTAISIATDADVFISLSSATPEELPQIFLSLFDTLSKSGYLVQKQNVSIGVKSGGYKIDFVPGKRQDQHSYDHSLYKSLSNSLITTDVNKHLQLVADSRRLDEIKLTKIWRGLNALNFPSFYLELVVLDCLAGRPHSNLSGNFWKVLGFLASNFPRRRYIDPANTDNVISGDLTYPEKKLIQRAARVARAKKDWGKILQ